MNLSLAEVIMTQNQQVKVVGINGQLSLGKEFAGQMVLIDQIEEGTWIIKTGTFIPDSEKWLHEGKEGSKLDKALAWAEKTKPTDNLDHFIKKHK
jgi:hypothetical protein